MYLVHEPGTAAYRSLEAPGVVDRHPELAMVTPETVHPRQRVIEAHHLPASRAEARPALFSSRLAAVGEGRPEFLHPRAEPRIGLVRRLGRAEHVADLEAVECAEVEEVDEGERR